MDGSKVQEFQQRGEGFKKEEEGGKAGAIVKKQEEEASEKEETVTIDSPEGAKEREELEDPKAEAEEEVDWELEEDREREEKEKEIRELEKASKGERWHRLEEFFESAVETGRLRATALLANLPERKRKAEGKSEGKQTFSLAN